MLMSLVYSKKVLLFLGICLCFNTISQWIFVCDFNIKCFVGMDLSGYAQP